ncbi:L,D-transpeptidase family protein [Phenylobacterium sp.]|uniref:L,D-transpeptidase family protein n=1 Tax=Phenylobacterium sp. TaxID=1871053 RepID=UPI002F9260C5
MALTCAMALPLSAAAIPPLPIDPPPQPPAWSEPAFDPADAVRQELQRLAVSAPPEVAEFYAARDHRPLWTPGELRPEALDVLIMLREAADDGLDPTAYEMYRLEEALHFARTNDPRALAEAELRLATAVTAYARDLHRGAVELDFVDPELAPKPPTLATLTAAPSLAEGLADLRRMNPLYEKLRTALVEYRAHWGEGRFEDLRDSVAEGDASPEALAGFQAAHGLPATGKPDAATREALDRGPAHYEQLILVNLERARALPADLGQRYILVDAASQRLWLYDRGQIVTTMKVVTGKETMPTPLMAGVIRQAVFSPYWNVPEDLVRTSVAPRALKEGLGYLQGERMEVFAGYEDDSPRLDPAQVDWQAVADGRLEVRVRQLPGPKNMMGKVKLEFRNPLGIFLHDTPMKELFGDERRTASSGCVRLEDAVALAKLLLGETPETTDPESRVDLPEPVPVYITYLTVQPTAQGLSFRPDFYRRDGEALQKIAARGVDPAGR